MASASTDARAINPAEAYDITRFIRENPAKTTRDFLGYDPWSMQADILDALAIPRNRVAVKAAHSVGKTSLAGQALLWRVMSGGIVISTAPTFNQVKNILWREVHTTYDKNKATIGGNILSTELRIDSNCYAMGISTNEGDRFQGHHGDILIIIDEAPGVKPDIWEAIEGIRAAGDVSVLALGNPTSVGNPFHSAFLTEGNDVGWDLFSIPAFATPNFKKFPTIASIEEASLEQRLAIPRPYLTNPQWVLEKYYEWGENSPMYQSRVMANFPTFSEVSLISMGWILAAASRQLTEPKEPRIRVGIDVAGPGENETVMYVRNGEKITKLFAWKDEDPREDCISALSDLRDEYGNDNMEVRVDSAGMGHYFHMDIKAAGFKVLGVNVGVAPIAKPLKKIKNYGATVAEQSKELKFVNLKAQLYWQLRDLFRFGQISDLLDEKTQGQLSTLQYEINDRGQIAIEKKEDMKKRGLDSPDRAEALMLCYGDLTEQFTNGKIYRPVITMFGASTGWHNPGDPFFNDNI